MADIESIEFHVAEGMRHLHGADIFMRTHPGGGMGGASAAALASAHLAAANTLKLDALAERLDMGDLADLW